MTFADSYLGQLRARIGSDLVLMPGAMVALTRADGQVLMTRRADDGTWCLPGGAAEVGGSFARTAVDELAEETGLVVEAADLTAFGTLSEAALHTVTYPSGDVTHAFALLFLVTRWGGTPRVDELETTAVRFAELERPPTPMHPASAAALRLLADYRISGQFQLR